ncbi:hypothetical protein HYQ46_002527 [Verticillium longisporum]|nr:hypothetical protein HYQ46_002527 [Verticillium longisporum]
MRSFKNKKQTQTSSSGLGVILLPGSRVATIVGVVIFFVLVVFVHLKVTVAATQVKVALVICLVPEGIVVHRLLRHGLQIGGCREFDTLRYIFPGCLYRLGSPLVVFFAVVTVQDSSINVRGRVDLRVIEKQQDRSQDGLDTLQG